MSRSIEWWDNFYLNLAKFYSEASKDPSTKVGSVIIDKDKRIISTGYNGLPKSIRDTYERLHNREIKYSLVIHAEANALLYAKTNLEGCSIFTWPFMPCSSCASLIIQSGIKRVVSLNGDNSRWQESFILAKEIFQEADVDLVLYDSIFPIDSEQI